MLLYNSRVSGNCYKVRLLLAHLDLDYDVHELDVVDRSDRPKVLGDLNPALRIPTIVLDDARPLAESNAILMYIAEGTRFLPEDRYERAQVLQWLFFEQYSHEPYLAVVRFWVAYAKAPPPPEAVEVRRADGYKALDALEDHLGRAASWSPNDLRSPTSRCTPTRMSLTRAGSTSRCIRPSAAGSSASPPKTATCLSIGHTAEQLHGSARATSGRLRDSRRATLLAVLTAAFAQSSSRTAARWPRMRVQRESSERTLAQAAAISLEPTLRGLRAITLVHVEG